MTKINGDKSKVLTDGQRIQLIRDYAAMLMLTNDKDKVVTGMQTIRNAAYARMQSELNRVVS